MFLAFYHENIQFSCQNKDEPKLVTDRIEVNPTNNPHNLPITGFLRKYFFN